MVICRYCIVLCKGLEHVQTLVGGGLSQINQGISHALFVHMKRTQTNP